MQRHWPHVSVVCTTERSRTEDSDVALEGTSKDCRRVRPRDASQPQQEKGFGVFFSVCHFDMFK